MKVPNAHRKYFWDTDSEKLDSVKNDGYIASRLLEYGDIEAARWLLKSISEEVIKKAVRRSRELSPKSRRFWNIFFRVPLKQQLWLKKSLPQTPKKLWPY